MSLERPWSYSGFILVIGETQSVIGGIINGYQLCHRGVLGVGVPNPMPQLSLNSASPQVLPGGPGAPRDIPHRVFFHGHTGGRGSNGPKVFCVEDAPSGHSPPDP